MRSKIVFLGENKEVAQSIPVVSNTIIANARYHGFTTCSAKKSSGTEMLKRIVVIVMICSCTFKTSCNPVQHATYTVVYLNVCTIHVVSDKVEIQVSNMISSVKILLLVVLNYYFQSNMLVLFVQKSGTMSHFCRPGNNAVVTVYRVRLGKGFLCYH
ncbi:hypothetical protein CL630_02480 [bacterium]|nr:hypothetical protein [bacterium]